MNENLTIIVGGGISGLTCARYLKKKQKPFLLLESSDRLGGRVKTDEVDGHLLDHGFQIFLTAYPEAKRLLDYEKLKLHSFYPGAIVRSEGKFYTLSDPWTHPKTAMKTLFSPIGNTADKVRIASVRTRARMMTLSEIMKQENKTTASVISEIGFTDSMTEKFLRPFLSGIFLEKDLDTSRRIFDFVFKMLASGSNTLPQNGMAAIPEQLASDLPADCLRTSCEVAEISSNAVTLRSGEKLSCGRLVLATEEPATRALLGIKQECRFNSQTTLYFSAPRAPVKDPTIVVNGEPDGFVTSLSVQSNVCENYAPRGKSLLAVTIVGDPDLSDQELERRSLDELSAWFPGQVEEWNLLKVYRVKYSLPDQSPEALKERLGWMNQRNGKIICGDFTETGSINGAMLAGRKAAELIE